MKKIWNIHFHIYSKFGIYIHTDLVFSYIFYFSFKKYTCSRYIQNLMVFSNLSSWVVNSFLCLYLSLRIVYMKSVFSEYKRTKLRIFGVLLIVEIPWIFIQCLYGTHKNQRLCWAASTLFLKVRLPLHWVPARCGKMSTTQMPWNWVWCLA